MKSPIVTLSDGSTVDLASLEKPLGMYPEEVREALKAHGGPYELYGCGRWIKADIPTFSLSHAHRAAPVPLTKPDPPWHMMADWVKAVARDEDGTIWAYKVIPRCGEGAWQAGARLCALDAFKIDPGTCDWRDSLVLRPEPSP